MWFYWTVFCLFDLQVWQNYQALWDLNADVLYGKLDNDLKLWMNTLEQIKYVVNAVYL